MKALSDPGFYRESSAEAPPHRTRLSLWKQNGRPPSRPQRPHWWLPGIHSFCGTWTKSCGADWGICGSEAGRPQSEAQGCGARGPGNDPCHHGVQPLVIHLFLLLLQVLLCSPCWAPAECVHWGQRGNDKHKGPVYSSWPKFHSQWTRRARSCTEGSM